MLLARIGAPFGPVVLVGCIAAVADSIVYPVRRNAHRSRAFVSTVENSRPASRGPRFITAVFAVAVIIVDRAIVDSFLACIANTEDSRQGREQIMVTDREEMQDLNIL